MQNKPTIVALLRNAARVYVGNSRFCAKPVFLVDAKNEGHTYELRGDASTSDHYAALVAEFGDVISKPDSPDAKITSIEFNTGRQYTPEGQLIEAWVVFIDNSLPESPLLGVYFNDTSRMISGYVKVRELTERAVMDAYDNGRYECA